MKKKDDPLMKGAKVSRHESEQFKRLLDQKTKQAVMAGKATAGDQVNINITPSIVQGVACVTVQVTHPVFVLPVQAALELAHVLILKAYESARLEAEKKAEGPVIVLPTNRA